MTPIEQLKNIIQELEQSNNIDCSKIGIGITTHNRTTFFNKSYEEIKRLAPKGSTIVVVDDASKQPVPNATYRFNENVGIARAKNKCLELLYLQGCEHFFLFDDDTYPIKENWHLPYINSKEPHLNYIFTEFRNGQKLSDSFIVYQDSNIVAYTHPRGCMLYYHRSALDAVGGMSPLFGRWGFEHVDLSNRIFNAGLTSFKYMDVPNSKELFYNDDEHQNNRNTSVPFGERRITEGQAIYNSRLDSTEYVNFIEKRNIILTCYFNNVVDTQRGAKWDNDITKLDPLIKSVRGKCNLVVLHDCFTADQISNYKDIEFVKVETSVTPYFQKWISFYQYIVKNERQINNVFCVDSTDVELLNYPDFGGLGNKLYCGDEDEILGCEWVLNHHKEPTVLNFIRSNKTKQLLNCGIVGGSKEVLKDFMRRMISYYPLVKASQDKDHIDMGPFNYIIHTYFADRVVSGGKVNTRFKEFKGNDYSWFKHK